MMTFLNV